MTNYNFGGVNDLESVTNISSSSGSTSTLITTNWTMPRWYYDKKELKLAPSILGGLDYDTENRYRREGARFIIDLGTSMNLSHITMATGVVYFHRFYMHHKFQDFPRFPTACACLFLAGKVEETPKKCKDVVKAAKGILSDNHFCQFGDDSRNPLEEVMTLERILLQTIKFDLQVEHPYNLLLKYAKCLKGDKQRLQKMVQMSWTFINDSLCTTLCLQWEPEIIAIALMYLAGKLSKFEVTDWNGRTSEHLRWWDMIVENMSIEILEDICHQVLDLYSHSQNPTSSLTASPQQNQPKFSNSFQNSPVLSPAPAAQQQASTSSNSTPVSVPTIPLPVPPPLPPPSSSLSTTSFNNLMPSGVPPPPSFVNSHVLPTLTLPQVSRPPLPFSIQPPLPPGPGQPPLPPGGPPGSNISPFYHLQQPPPPLPLPSRNSFPPLPPN